ncbi:MAG: RNA-binding domain-containing protein, partial [Akkermansia sp.]
MLEEELLTLIETIRRRGCEGQTTEVKAAAKGCPEKLYDTMSSFSNQDDGGVFVFGLDETQHFEAVGVYNAQDLQKR